MLKVNIFKRIFIFVELTKLRVDKNWTQVKKIQGIKKDRFKKMSIRDVIAPLFVKENSFYGKKFKT